MINRNANIHRTHKAVPGGAMSAVHFGPISTPVRLILLHANGFHGLAYRSILEPLSKTNGGIHVIGLDLRGHGQTNLPAKADAQFASFHTYADDVAAYLKRHIDEPVVMAGHSLGGSTAILANEKVPEKITNVLGLDPIILPWQARWIMKFSAGRKYMQKHFPLAKSAAKRRDTFETFEAAFKRYQGRGPFKHFSDEALWDYVSGGFVQEDGHVRLACRPRWEQFTYTAQSHNLARSIQALPSNSRLMITSFVSKTTSRSPKFTNTAKHVQIDHRPELEHFFPLINPDITIAALKESLGL